MMLRIQEFLQSRAVMRFPFKTFALLLALTPADVRAQMALPGAVFAPTPTGQASAPPPAHAPRKSGEDIAIDKHFTPAKPPALDAVIGKPFALSGSRGALTVEKSGADLRLSRLTLAGDKISRPNQACEVAMGGDEALKLKSLGAPDGVQRYELESSACPVQFDVLNGALKATGPAGACNFTAADCRVDATGLWGPSGDTFGEAQIKSLERERTDMEKAVRAHFRGLLARAKADKAATQAAVREQAEFSSQRAQTCRDYDREEKHGFCALRVTEARDFRLQSRLAGLSPAPDKKDAARKPPKKPPVAPPSPAGATIAPTQ